MLGHAHWRFRLLLALPAFGMLIQFMLQGSWSRLITQSGEWAIRMLILTLAVTPLRLLMKQLHASPQGPAWLLKHRRDIGMACFLYAALHLSVYLLRQWNIHVVLFDLRSAAYMLGWIGFATLLALAVTSNDASVHSLGRWWKPLQRVVYLSAIAAFLHWYLIRQDHGGLWLHLVPLVLLEAYRVVHNFARPAGVRH